jgi:PqqA peptide cyclase
VASPPYTSSAPLYLDPSVAVGWRNDRYTLDHSGVELSHELSPEQALALLLLGDLGDASLARETAREIDPALAGGIDQVVARFPAYLRGSERRAIDGDWWGQRLSSAVGRLRVEQAAPASVTWLLTLECNRRCPYCFYRIIPVDGSERRWPRDATLRGEAASAVIAEMIAIGVADLYLTGGEPMLRPDINSLVAQASNGGIRVHMVTKFAIDDVMARGLAQAGLSHITISLDDLRAEVGRSLTGTADYVSEALSSISACLAAGLLVEVNAVITSLNAPGLPALAQRLEELGCPLFTISPMQVPHFRSSNVGRLETAAHPAALLERIREQLTGRMTVASGGAEPGARPKPCGATLVCEVGRRALHILPNGDATRCHYVPDTPELVIGSLLTQSIMDIWTGERFDQWREPKRPSFAGTSCSGCGGFDACNGRGRCVASAYLEHDRMHAPDAFCSRN